MRCILLIGVLLAGSLELQAQKLSAADSTEIQQQALRHVRQFEGLLNLVAQPDKYFRKYSFTRLIRSFYDEQSHYRIFRDSLVAVEDDLNPNAQPDADNFLSVKDYLQAFFSFYEKSPVASVYFSDYRVSPVKEGEYTYVEVYYLSEFTNLHRAYPDHPYPARHNKATVRAQRQETGWQVIISNINYYQPDQKPVAPLAEDRTATPQSADPLALLTLPQAGDTPSSLSAAPPDRALIEDLSRALADSSSTLQLLDRLDRGSDYQLRLYDSVSVFKPAERLPFVTGSVIADADNAIQKSTGEIFKRFAPLVRKTGASSVQVAFDNPADDSLFVELINTDQEVLFAEAIASGESYATAINLENLEEDSYQVRVSNQNYDHRVRVYYQPTPSDSTEQRSTAAFADFKPYIVKQDGQSSVQVVFKNPIDAPLTVELVDKDELVLYSEEVAGKQSYARSISLENLYRGSYWVRIAHNDYQHTVRVYY